MGHGAHVGAVATPIDYPKLPQTTQETAQETAQEPRTKLSLTQQKIVDYLKRNPSANRKELAMRVQLSYSTFESRF